MADGSLTYYATGKRKNAIAKVWLVPDGSGTITVNGRDLPDYVQRRTLEQIVLSVKKVSDIVAEIAAASQEQSSGIEQVNKAVMQMDEMTQQNAALVEEAAAASEAVDAQAQSLRQLMAFFKVDTQTDETGPRVTASVVHPPVQPGKKPVSRPGSASSPGASKPGAMRQETMARPMAPEALDVIGRWAARTLRPA